jgi:nicotinamide-nucleotide amidase
MSKAQRLITALGDAGLKLVTAESCTGGLIAGLLTEIPGSSAVVDRGFITYSNAAKSEMLGIAPALIVQHGAVSGAVAAAMAEGGLSRSAAHIAVSVTGVAGPSGGTVAKPVGLVYLAVAQSKTSTVVREHHFGDLGRQGIRLSSIDAALDLVTSALNANTKKASD